MATQAGREQPSAEKAMALNDETEEDLTAGKYSHGPQVSVIYYGFATVDFATHLFCHTFFRGIHFISVNMYLTEIVCKSMHLKKKCDEINVW